MVIVYKEQAEKKIKVLVDELYFIHSLNELEPDDVIDYVNGLRYQYQVNKVILTLLVIITISFVGNVYHDIGQTVSIDAGLYSIILIKKKKFFIRGFSTSSRLMMDDINTSEYVDLILDSRSITDNTELTNGYRNQIREVTNGEYFNELSEKLPIENLFHREIELVNKLNNVKDRINQKLLKEANQLNVNMLLLNKENQEDDSTEMIEYFIDINKNKIKDLVNELYIIKGLYETSLYDSERIAAYLAAQDKDYHVVRICVTAGMIIFAVAILGLSHHEFELTITDPHLNLNFINYLIFSFKGTYKHKNFNNKN